MRKYVVLMIGLLLASTVAFAHGDALAEGEEIVDQKIPCEELSEEQLEAVGDYYMEQMHPGEQHVRMDEMMGGEGSESLRDMHIRMARSMYCGDHEMMGPGMMDRMMQGPGFQQSKEYSGFSTLNALLLVVLAGLVSAAAYRIWKDKKPS